MPSMRFNAHLDTSHHGPLHPRKNDGLVAVSLTGIHNTMCLFVVKRSFIDKGVYVSPQVKAQRIQVRRSWRPCSGSSCTYPSGMIRVFENISHSTEHHHACTTLCSDCQR
jgi:hypothetical protein